MQSSSAVMARLMMPVVEASMVMREASSSVARLASSMAGTISRLPAPSRGVIMASWAGAGDIGGAHCTWTVTCLPPCRVEYSYKYLHQIIGLKKRRFSIIEAH